MAQHTNLINLHNLTKDIKVCHETMDEVLNYLLGKNNTDIKVMKEDWQDYGEDKDYVTYSLDIIVEELQRNGAVGIRLENGSGSMNDQTFDHSFVLVVIDNNIYRIESYVGYYCTRIVLYNNYYKELFSLITSKPGKERIKLWNNIFNVSMKEDTDEPILDIELTVRSL